MLLGETGERFRRPLTYLFFVDVAKVRVALIKGSIRVSYVVFIDSYDTGLCTSDMHIIIQAGTP